MHFQWIWDEKTIGPNSVPNFVLSLDLRQEGWTGQELLSDVQVVHELAAASKEIPEGATCRVEEQGETWIVTFPAMAGEFRSARNSSAGYSGTKKRGSRQEDYSVSIALSNPARKLTTPCYSI